MKKQILLLAALAFTSVVGWAQTSPYQGVAPGDIVSGNDYYLYNVESGLWLQNNDRKANDWHTRGQLGTRGLDFQLNASGEGYKINAKFGRQSINRDDYYLDNNDDHIWQFVAVEKDGISNAVNIKSDAKYLTADSYAAGKGYNNQYNAGTPGQNQWYLNNPDNNNNGTWQIVTKAERLEKMLADGETVAQDATWLVASPDFANNDRRYDKWVKTGTWVRGGDANGDWGRGSMIIESWNSGSTPHIYQIASVPNGMYSVTVQGFYRDGGTDGVGAKHNNGTEEIRAKYYANDVEKNLRSVIDGHDAAVLDPNRWRVNTDGWYVPDAMDDASRCMNIDFGYPNDALEVKVTNGQLKIGVYKTGGVEKDWVIFDNWKVTYLGPIDVSEVLAGLNAEITKAEAFDANTTTEALATALATALANAKSKTSSLDADEIGDATSALATVLTNAQNVNVVVLRETVALAKAEGITTTVADDFLVNGTDNGKKDDALRLVRNLRKLNAIEKVDITKIECSEPTNVEADYYLYNVGAGIFFSTTADWGCHIAIDNPGMLIHFRPDGEWSGAPGRPVFHLSGNGWDGMNWSEEYWDKDGVNKLAFVPVEGKDKVYNMCEWDAYNWHFVYDPAEDVCDGNTHYWNSVQKRDWNRNDYKDNPYAQWMLVSPAAYKAAMEKATEDSKLDVTYLIENPNFTKAKVDGKDNWTRGWTGVGGQMRGQDREPWMVIEWFERSADMKQTITNLPAGKYEVSCYGFYRDGDSNNEAGKVLNGETLRQDAYLVANDAQVALPNVTSAAGMMPGIGESHGLDADFACWPWQANEYFQTGLYKATVPVEVGADGELTIGVEYEHTTGADGSWVVVGNFRLTCLEVYKASEVAMSIRSNGNWGGVQMDEADDSTPIKRHFTATSYYKNDVQQEGIFINFKNGDDWYCPAGGENVVVNTGKEITEIVKLAGEKAGWVVQNQTGYMKVDVYCTHDGMKVVFNDNTLEAMKDVNALYVVGEQTTAWSRESSKCPKLEKKAAGVYEGTVEIKRDNMLFDAARIITLPDNGDNDNHIGALNVGQQAIVGTRTLGTGSTGRMYLRKGENKITVDFNAGTINVEPINPEPSYMYAVGTLVDHAWQNTNTTYKLDEIEPNVFKGIVKVAQDDDARFSLFCERTRDDWGDGRFGPADESIKPEQGVATTNNISCSWDRAWRVPAGTWMVTLDIANQTFLYDQIHTQNVVVGSTGYATFVAEYPYTVIPTDAKVNAAQLNGEYVHLEEMTEVPAGEAVVIAAPAGTYTFTEAAVAKSSVENDLKAATAEVTADGTQYILAQQEGKAGFYKATEGTTIAAGKGYLVIDEGAAVKAFYPFGEETATGIIDANADANDGKEIYNLAGQRISKAVKGINIVNGKKVLK